MSNEQNELIKEFIVECLDQLDAVDNDLIKLENDPNNKDMLSKIFRAFHNMKGSSGFLGFKKLESLTHVGESLLSKMREGLIQVNSEIVLSLIAMSDAVRQIFKEIEATGQDGNNDYVNLKNRLQACMSNTKSNEKPKTSVVEKPKDALDLEIEKAIAESKSKNQNQSITNTNSSNSDKSATSNGEHHEEHEQKRSSDTGRIGEDGKSVADSSIRVDLTILDSLMNLVGELVLTRNQMLQLSDTNTNPLMTKSLQVLNRITSDLQTEVMKTRMQPINTIFSKFPRIVRQLSESLNKKINLEIEGKETELDRTLIDSLRDPLTHMVRNSVDHGVELPEKRIAKGKNETGTITLKAYHKGGQVHIDIIDDGAGIDPQKIKAKAIEKGLLTSEQAETKSEKDLLNMIFLPGFSTATVITNISGRGVGMDVVRTNIEKIGGTVEISSEVGKGSLFNLKVPLTLAIIPALIIGVGETSLAIPQVSIRELYLLEKDNKNAIEMIHGFPVFHLRKESIPLLYLRQELGLPAKDNSKDEPINIIILQIEDQSIGLVVDEIYDSQEIVVKPLPAQLEGLVVYSGATILGDGRISMIIDVLGLSLRANAISKSQKNIQSNKNVSSEAKDLTRLLVCRSIDDGRIGVAFDKIARLESIDKSHFEKVGGREILQYRDSTLMVYRVLNYLPERRKQKREIENNLEIAEFLEFMEQDTVHVIICNIHGVEVGFVIGKILDSIEADLRALGMPTRNGVVGTILSNKRVIEYIDFEKMLREMDPDFYKTIQMRKVGNG